MKPLICKHEGCGRPVKGRGMCQAHYAAWYRTTERKPARESAIDLVLAELAEQDEPGTRREIAARTGLHEQVVGKAIATLREQKLVHVFGHLPPKGKNNYVRVFAAGPGPDAKISARQKVDHYNATRRERFAIKKTVSKGDALVGAFFGSVKHQHGGAQCAI